MSTILVKKRCQQRGWGGAEARTFSPLRPAGSSPCGDELSAGGFGGLGGLVDHRKPTLFQPVLDELVDVVRSRDHVDRIVLEQSFRTALTASKPDQFADVDLLGGLGAAYSYLAKLRTLGVPDDVHRVDRFDKNLHLGFSP